MATRFTVSTWPFKHCSVDMILTKAIVVSDIIIAQNIHSLIHWKVTHKLTTTSIP